jgi:hypothetical protein
MKKLFVAGMAALFVCNIQAGAQYYYYNDRYYDSPVVFELGVSGGIMNAMTDLGGKKGEGKGFIKDLRWQTARPSYGLYILGTYNNAIGARLEGTFGTVTGYDSILQKVGSSSNGRYDRNLSFKSRISELQLAIEVHPLFFRDFGENNPPRISPYLIAGAGVYSFDPQASLSGSWYSLKLLRTEGQGFSEYPSKKQYELTQLNVLGGLGLRCELNNTFFARLELVHRMLFTDYLDDVSTTYIDPALFNKYLPANMAAIATQLYNRKAELNPAAQTNVGDKRGNADKNDAYFTVQMKLGFTFGRKKR